MIYCLIAFLSGSFLSGCAALIWHLRYVSDLRNHHKSRMKVNMDRARAAGWNDCVVAHRDKSYAKL